MVIEIVKGLVLFLGGILSVSLFLLATRVASARKADYDRNRERSGTLFASLRGEVSTVFDGGRDDIVAAGVAVDQRRNAWKEQGKLSEEAVSSVLR